MTVTQKEIVCYIYEKKKHKHLLHIIDL